MSRNTTTYLPAATAASAKHSGKSLFLEREQSSTPPVLLSTGVKRLQLMLVTIKILTEVEIFMRVYCDNIKFGITTVLRTAHHHHIRSHTTIFLDFFKVEVCRSWDLTTNFRRFSVHQQN